MGEQIVGRAPSRGRQLGMDMVRSLGLVALALGAWMFFAHPRTPEAVRTVEWYPTATAAAAAVSYDVLAPPSTWPWGATSARIEPQPDGTIIWRVGYLTPAEDYAALLQRGVFPAQAAGTRDEWITSETRNGVAAGSVTLGGRSWVRMEGDPKPDDKRSLVNDQDGTVTIVTGSAEWPELEQLAASLGPVGG